MAKNITYQQLKDKVGFYRRYLEDKPIYFDLDDSVRLCAPWDSSEEIDAYLEQVCQCFCLSGPPPWREIEATSVLQGAMRLSFAEDWLETLETKYSAETVPSEYRGLFLFYLMTAVWRREVFRWVWGKMDLAYCLVDDETEESAPTDYSAFEQWLAEYQTILRFDWTPIVDQLRNDEGV
ncbi:hypothetical protein NKE62_01245 [Akkermansia sp. Marseille-P9185]|uniref:hypothetical protein n=1 Tax=Akkermansia massiliensis TaxID=2927224 RepID=UPI002030923A|nr:MULTISPECIES: hypothetical protein [Akkermansia]MCM0684727.1 hypothetical protein [Akkermansia sp. B2-R-115]MCO8185544.1 hypothetical protein [Akkermansia massiliensis]